MSFDILFQLESELADYTGAPYVVLTDGCTHAIELVMRFYKVKQTAFTAFTYISVPQTIAAMGIEYKLTDEKWIGEYQFENTNIWDSARRLEQGMYRKGQVQCLSFGYSKPLQIGKVGAILLDDQNAYWHLSRMRSDGRDLAVSPWESQQIFSPGWHYCPTLEDCQRGLAQLGAFGIGECQKVTYPDCRQISLIV